MDAPFDREKFLKELESHGEPVLAARTVGTTVAAVSRLRKEDQGFDERYRDAKAYYRALIGQEVDRRGRRGVKGPPVFNPKTGEVEPGYEEMSEYSDRLLILQARRHNAAYREKLTATVRRKIEFDELGGLSPKERDELEQWLEASLKNRKKEE